MLVTEQLIEHLNNGKIVVSDVGATIPGINTTEDKLQFLYEACSASVKEDLNTAKVPVAIKAAGVDADGHWTRQNLAQVIWLLAQEVAGQEALLTKLKDLVQDLQKAALTGKNDLLEVAPVHFLAELGVVPQTTARKPEAKAKADLFYKLNKFSALREENEGFSKMVVCLQSFGAAAAANSGAVPQLMLEIKSLIGYFDLDPNRVAALTLDIFQEQWDNRAYLQLLPLFSDTAVSAALAFTYTNYQAEGEMAPDNLYRMTVQLIQADAASLDSLWVHLSPDDNTLKTTQLAAQSSASESLKAQNNLNKDINQIEASSEEFGVSAEKFNLDPRELLATSLQSVWANNHKLELLRVAFEMESLGLAWHIYKGLKACGIEPADYPPIGAWMAARVLTGISPSAPPGLHPYSEAEEVTCPSMSAQAESLLNIMGLAYSLSIALWIRLVRYWKQYLAYQQQQVELHGAGASSLEAAVNKVCGELVQRLIPGLSLTSPNPFLAAELWYLLELLPYSKRFEVYEDVSRLLNDGSAESMDAICLKAAAENVHRLTKRLASRMGFDKDTNRIETAERKKEKLKQAQGLSRNFAKVSHSNPIIVAEYLVSYVQNNGSHIDSLTDSMGDLSDVVLDITTYRVVRTFTVARNRYKLDSVLISDHLASASRLAAMAARKLTRDGKHGSGGGVELHALLQLVLNAGLKSHSEVFVILGDLIDICAAVHILEDAGDTELPALAGGDVLRTIKIIGKEVRQSSKVAKAGMERLSTALTLKQQGRPLAVPLFVVMAQNRSLHILGQDRGLGNVDARLKPEDRIRVVSDRFDQANRLLIQYADFLRLALDKVTYRDLMPSLADLLDPNKYGLEPEVAFLLYRPVLSRVPFPAPPSAKDEEDGEIPEGDQVPMEVEQETSFGQVRWSHLLQAVDVVLPPDAQKGLTKPFYLLFWRLTFSDIHNASPEYDKQIRLLQREVKDAEEEATACSTAPVPSYGAYTPPNPKYIASSEDRKLALKHYKAKQDLLKDQVRLLEREKSKMEDRRREGVQLFRLWKDHLLADADHSKTIPAFISHCLLPRCILTPDDAMYCAAFIRRLTLEDTPYFSFMLCAQLLVPTGLTLLYTMTEREADNFGIFFREVLSSIKGWWVNQEELKGLLPRQGFRMDGRQFAASADSARHASASDYSIFVASVQGKTVTKLVEIFKANAQNNVNLRAAGNAMLLLNKIKTVCPMVIQHARSMVAVLRPIFTRLEPAKDAQGNFMEQPVPLYNLAFRCHTDLNNTVQANTKFDSGASSVVPAIRLFDRALPGWDPQYVTRPAPPPPAPQRRPATAAPKPAAARGEAAAATPAAATAPAGNTASATAADKVSKETLNSIKGPPDGGARATSTGRGTKEGADKEAKPHRASRDATSRNGSAAREGKESAARDGRDAKGKETSTRGGREHTDKGTREGSRATAATGKAADDKQLAEVRAAALKRQSSASGEAADGSRKASPAAQEEAAKGGKAALANGTAVAAGTKRRAPDSAPAETRGAKAAKTDAAAAPQAGAVKASVAAPPAPSRPSTRRTGATAGDKEGLRADAPEFKPSPKRPAEVVNTRSGDISKKRPSTAQKAPAKGTDKHTRADEGKASGAAADKLPGADADKPSGGSARPPVHPEPSPRTANKRARDGEAEDAKKAATGPSQAGADEQEPKRRKHKPIAWAPQAAAADPQEPIARRASAEQRDEPTVREQPHRASSDLAKVSSTTSAEAKHEQRSGRARPEEDRRHTRSDVATEADDRKHAQRDGHRVEPESRKPLRDSHRAEAETQHAKRNSHETEAGHRDRNARSPRDSHRIKDMDAGARRSSADTRHSLAKSDDRKAPKAVAPEEQEDGEVGTAQPAARPPALAPPEPNSEANGVASVAPAPHASPDDQHNKDDSDGKESKRSHKRGHKSKDKKEKREHKDKKKKEKKEKDPEREKAKAEKKAEKAAAAAAAVSADATAKPASSPASLQPAAAAEAAEPVPRAADTAAAAPAVPRLASSIAKGNSPAGPPRLESRISGGARESSDPPLAASARPPALASSVSRPGRLPEHGRDAEDTLHRLSRADRRDGSGNRDARVGSNSAAASLQPPDLREFLRSKSRNQDPSSKPDPPVAEKGVLSRNQKSQQSSAHAPKVLSSEDGLDIRRRRSEK